MSVIKGFFTEADGTISWRKIMTCGALFSFLVAVIGFLVANKFSELPTAYMLTIDGVFVFYFGKNVVSSLGQTSQPKQS